MCISINDQLFIFKVFYISANGYSVNTRTKNLLCLVDTYTPHFHTLSLEGFGSVATLLQPEKDVDIKGQQSGVVLPAVEYLPCFWEIGW